MQDFRIPSVFLPINSGKSAHSDEISQIPLDFLKYVCSNHDTTLRMHWDRGTGQKAPPATHLTVGLRFIDV